MSSGLTAGRRWLKLRSMVRARLWRIGLGMLALIEPLGSSWAAEGLSAADERVNRAIGAHVAFLADDLLEGRAAGSAGHELAARYVVSKFARMGLRPGGDEGGWLQTVPLMESQLVPDSARMELHVDGRTEALEYNLEFLSGPQFTGTNLTVTAPLVFVGYGVRAPELGYDDFAGVDVRGKIAVMLAKAPPRFPATALAHHANARQKSRSLVEAGAVGVIGIPTPKDLEETPWARRIMQSRFPAMRTTDAAGNPEEVYPQLKASVNLSPQGVGKLFAKAPQPVTEVLSAAARSEPPRFPLGIEATLHTHSEHRRLVSPNVIGILPGRDPRLAGESVVLTAHLDHMGRGPAVDGDTIYNGAYDNAIGVALMLEVARALMEEGRRPRRTVVFAAVTAEEKGLRGSEFLARHLPASAGRPVANINLDMVLLGAPTRRYTVLGTEHSTLRGPVEFAAKRMGLELVPDPRPDRVVFVRSDQYSFVRQGVPAIFPKVADGGGVPVAGQLSPDQFLKEHYHRPSDEATLPRDAESSVRFARFVTLIARRVADAVEAPRWNPGDFFGETFGKGAGKGK